MSINLSLFTKVVIFQISSHTFAMRIYFANKMSLVIKQLYLMRIYFANKTVTTAGGLPILPVGDVLYLASVAPAANDAVGGAWIDAEGGGGFGVGLAVEIGRKGFEELALLEGGSRGCDRGCRLSRVGFREC